jgi:predicted nucleic acid-binding protein
VTAAEKPRVVFDTMLFLQAVGSGKGAAYAAPRRFEAGEFRLFVSRETLEEVRDVLSRPEIRRKLSLLTDERVDALIRLLESRATPLALVPRCPRAAAGVLRARSQGRAGSQPGHRS